MNSFEIIKTIRLTEKGAMQSDELNQYTVVADKRANKVEIRKAVEELFKVNVLRVNTMNVNGKARRRRTIHEGATPRWKKAIVTLKDGESIDLA
jgi:large subunit ribosomal protein L23